MDEQTMELFAHLHEVFLLLAKLQIIDMLASGKYTTSMKIVLIQMLISVNGGQLPMDVSEITGKDETALLEMIMSNDGGNGGGSEPENPNTPTE